jgi:hypothetical protein
MVFVYIVRCNFTHPEKEQAWNAWYSGPKMAQMLAKPYFRTCQRFRLALGSGRSYFTLWTLQSPDAFKTAEYTSDWGFYEWAQHVTDWSRDLFDARSEPEAAFAVMARGALHTVAFDGMNEEEANAARAVIEKSRPKMMWLPGAGLDRHTPMIGLRPLPDLAGFCAADHRWGQRMQEAIYRPITDLNSAIGTWQQDLYGAVSTSGGDNG